MLQCLLVPHLILPGPLPVGLQLLIYWQASLFKTNLYIFRLFHYMLPRYASCWGLLLCGHLTGDATCIYIYTFHMLVLWSGTNFHITSGGHSLKPRSNKPSTPICLARTTSLKVFVLFATPVAGWVSWLGYIFCSPLPPLPHFCHFLSLLAAVLLLAAFACFVVIVVVQFYTVLLWSTSSPNEMGRSRSLLYYFYYCYVCKEVWPIKYPGKLFVFVI